MWRAPVRARSCDITAGIGSPWLTGLERETPPQATRTGKRRLRDGRSSFHQPRSCAHAGPPPPRANHARPGGNMGDCGPLSPPPQEFKLFFGRGDGLWRGLLVQVTHWRDEVWEEHLRAQRRGNPLRLHPWGDQGFPSPARQSPACMRIRERGVGAVRRLRPGPEWVLLWPPRSGVRVHHAVRALRYPPLRPRSVWALLLHGDALLGAGERAPGLLLPEAPGRQDVRDRAGHSLRGGHRSVRGRVAEPGRVGAAARAHGSRSVAGEDAQDFRGAQLVAGCAAVGLGVRDLCDGFYDHAVCQHPSGLGYSQENHCGGAQVGISPGSVKFRAGDGIQREVRLVRKAAESCQGCVPIMIKDLLNKWTPS